MRKFVFLGVLMTLHVVASAQNVENLIDLKPEKEYENIHVQKLSSDERASTFAIWVKENVRPHKHELHTENLYVISGEAKMTVGDETSTIKAGDFLTIPENTIHSVKVTSNEPLKVLSVQSPEFLGKDRVFVD